MMGKRPFIGKLSDLLIPGSRARPSSDPMGSPRTPLDLKVQSPRGLRGYDLGGVGLGIVVALERSGEDVPGDKRCVRSPRLGRPGRAPAWKGEGCAGVVGGGFEDVEVEVEVDCLENYTYVTCHGPDKSSTKVYHDGVSIEPSSSEEGVPGFQTLDFLSSCHLCGKKLHDRDIYMYRGEKAFCSTECRSKQIMIDERKEQKCRSEASKAADLSSSPYTNGRIFSTGIVAM